jgi:thymidylate kinase
LNARRAAVVALCGIDGTGKTTLFRELARRLRHPDIELVPRGLADRERRVERETPRSFGDYRDWIEGPFSEAIAAACAHDFREHYRRTIEPLARTRRLVINDRYATCFVAYALCLRNPCREALEVLEEVPPPDLVIHLTADEATIRRRIAERIRRGEAEPNEFEHPESQRRLLAGYRALFSEYSGRVVEVDNGGSLEEGLDAVLEELSGLVPEVVGEALTPSAADHSHGPPREPHA